MGEQSKTISLSKIKSNLLEIKDKIDEVTKELMNLPDTLPINQKPKSEIMAKKNQKFEPPLSKSSKQMKSMQKQALSNITISNPTAKARKKK